MNFFFLFSKNDRKLKQKKIANLRTDIIAYSRKAEKKKTPFPSFLPPILNGGRDRGRSGGKEDGGKVVNSGGGGIGSAAGVVA